MEIWGCVEFDQTYVHDWSAWRAAECSRCQLQQDTTGSSEFDQWFRGIDVIQCSLEDHLVRWQTNQGPCHRLGAWVFSGENRESGQ
jgi:hypothetical protein